MPFSFLYYTEQTSSPSFKCTPPGILDVVRLINGQACWRQFSPSLRSKPKSLILADWTARFWSDATIENIIKKLDELITDGFPIYIWQEGNIEPIPKDSLFRLKNGLTRERITLAPADEILKIAVKQQACQMIKQGYVLDDHSLPCLLEDKNPFEQPRTLDIACLLPKDAPEEFAVMHGIIALLKKETPPLTQLTHREFSSSANQLYRDLLRSEFVDSSSFSHFTIYRGLELDSKKLSTLCSVGHMIVDGCDFVFSDLRKIESFTLNKSLDLDFSATVQRDLATVLKTATALKKLSLITCQSIPVFTPETFPALTQMEDVDVSSSNICFESVNTLLRQSQSLKTLRLLGCSDVLGHPEFKTLLRHTSLQAISLAGTEIRFDFLQECLPPSLKELHLLFCQHLKSQPDNPVSLPPIETLRLEHASNITPVLLQQLTQTGSIEILYLTHGLALQQFPEGISFHLPSLKKLTLNTSVISLADLQRMLKTATGLEELHLTRCRALNQEKPESLHLPALKKLSLRYCSPVGQDVFQNLLDSSPSLQHLCLWSSGDLLPQLLAMTDILPLSSLQTLMIDNLERNSLVVEQLQKRLPFLKIISANIEEPSPLLSDYAAPPPEEPHHNPDEFIREKPTDTEHFRFTFKSIHDRLSQDMIIDKLSRYLTLVTRVPHFSGPPICLIPLIQDGICDALVHFFENHPLLTWNNRLEELKRWNGLAEVLPQLGTMTWFLNKLTEYIVEHHVFPHPRIETFLGDNFLSVLRPSKKTYQRFILSNPWHSIVLHRLQKPKNHWEVYDPNFPGGAKIVGKEALKSQVQESLGSLIFIEGRFQNEPLINEHFLELGGLLALCVNPHNSAKLLTLLRHPPEPFRETDFKGLLFRSTEGYPAWLLGLRNPQLKRLTTLFLSAYLHRYPDGAPDALNESLEALSPQEKWHCIQLLGAVLAEIRDDTPKKSPPSASSSSTKHKEKMPPQTPPGNALASLETLISSLHTYTADDYEKELQTWRKPTPLPTSLLTYCQSIASSRQGKKKLIELDSPSSIQGLKLALLKYCSKHPIFCINSPNEAVCLAPYIKHEGTSGRLMPGPGGPLHDFLRQNESTEPIIVVDLSHFEAEDIVRHNSMLDEMRKLDGTPIPKGAIVIALINPNKPGCYQGEDLYSRFDHVSICPFSKRGLQADPFLLPKEHDPEGENQWTIDLAKSVDWKGRLLGEWFVHQHALQFKEGELIKALKQLPPPTNIHIQNGPWMDESFQTFWQQMILRGTILHAGESIIIPTSIQWTRSDGYHWDHLLSNVQFDLQLNPSALALNSGRLGEFFQQYECHNTSKTINALSGRIKQHEGNSMEVNLTRNLSQNEWGLFLLECNKYGVRLQCHLAPGVELPDDFHIPPFDEPPQSQDIRAPLVITSNDVFASVVAQTSQDPSAWITIPISECDPSDLLSRLDGKAVEQHLGSSPIMDLEFHEETCAVLEALETPNKRILLYGHFSDELMDSLAPWLLSPETARRFVFVSDNPDDFKYCQQHREHQRITNEQKMEFLRRVFSDEPEIESYMAYLNAHSAHLNESFSHLCARFRYGVTSHRLPEMDWDRAFSVYDTACQSMSSLPINHKLGPFNPESSLDQARAFDKERSNSVLAHLERWPYVLIIGLTSTGKTTYIGKHIKTNPNVDFYQGTSELRQWAEKISPKKKVLVIDEANLSPSQWTLFNGLFHPHPTLLIDGHIYPLTPEHKVIFLSNPLSHGGERQLPHFFSAHPNPLVFDLLPLNYTYEYILKPILSNEPVLQDYLPDAMIPLLEVYDFICQHSENEVLISPRELQMMALLCLTHARKEPTLPTKEQYLQLARHYAYQLGKPLIPRHFQEAFDAAFPIADKPSRPSFRHLGRKDHAFIVTPSRTPIVEQLSTVLELLDLRRRGELQNEDQYYGGLGGIVLEGDSACGKSELVMALLLSAGYQEEHHYQIPTAHEKPFYHIPVGMDDKERVLLKAFHEGAVVVIDEINSSPMMEALLNGLLMGRDPDGNRPMRPGFFVIGTQNPVTLDGRIKRSTAEERRVLTIQVPPYAEDEMVDILVNQSLLPQDASSMVKAFAKNTRTAKQQHLKPPPTFRDLVKLAKKTLSARKATKQRTPPLCPPPPIHLEHFSIFSPPPEDNHDSLPHPPHPK